ncbi:hypothetical protein [Streptomyces sp. CA-179760]|uniref:hypothetical protein n=1 Tax=Streptomyces sp. CA-179760 TaxID=3240054 RepID=UPI003D8D2454
MDRTIEAATAVPYFWSDRYGARIRFAGRRTDGDIVRITEGELSDSAPAEGGFFSPGTRGTAGRPRCSPWTARARSCGRDANSHGTRERSGVRSAAR